MSWNEMHLTTDQIFTNTRALLPELRSASAEIEAARRLPQRLVDDLTQAGVFRIAMPRAWGGPEMSPLDQIALIELVSQADGSAGWCTSILSDSGFYAAYLEEEEARAAFPELDSRVAGMLAPVGRAERVEGGYRVTGEWAFGSGCLHADRITGGCLVSQGGELELGSNGLPAWRIMIFELADVVIKDTWHTTGMAGSGSNHYSVSAAFVPESRSFSIFEGSKRSEPLYAYHGLFFANAPGVPLGLGRAAIEALKEIAQNKRAAPSMQLLRDEYRVQLAAGEAEASLLSARSFVWDVMGDLWATLEAGSKPSTEQRARVGMMMIHTAHAAQRSIELACEAVGSDTIYRGHPLERVRRDILAVNTHIVHARKTYASVGQLLLGGQGGPTMF